MTSGFDRLAQPLRRRVWHPVRGIMDIFHLLPAIAALVIFQLLWSVGQIRELYFSYLEQKNWEPILFGFVGFSLVSTALYLSHYSLSAIRQNIIYANFMRPNIGRNFHRLQRSAGWVWAFLPWLGLAAGLHEAGRYLSQKSVRPFGERGLESSIWPAIIIVILVGLAVVILLGRVDGFSQV